MTSTKVQLDKFEGTGFHTWQKKLQYHLMREGLFYIAKGKEEKPEGTTKATTAWEERDGKALGTIALALHDNYIHYIYECTNAAQAWETLEKQFGAQAKFSKISLLIEFFKLKQDGKEVAIHVNHLKNLMSQLSSIENPIEEDIATAILLASLDHNYDNLITTLTNLPNINLESTILALQEEERKQKARLQEGHYGGSAYLSHTKHFNKPGGTSKFSAHTFPKCRYCKKTNHKEIDCYFKKNQAHLVEEDPEEHHKPEASTNEANLVEESWSF